jgi:acyl-coenzyme A thioesterase PaaI-like protein
MTVPTDDAAQAYRHALATAAHPPPAASSAIRLVSAVRRLVELTNANDADDALLEAVADDVERLATALAGHAEASHYPHGERLAGAAGFFLAHPVIGPINPLAPGIVMTPSGDDLVGEVTYGPPYEGPQGFVHGGHIEAGFDAILAMTAGMHGRGGLTRSLHVDFLAPTPLNTPVRYVGTIEERRERSTGVRAELFAGSKLCARGTSVQVMRRPT